MKINREGFKKLNKKMVFLVLFALAIVVGSVGYSAFSKIGSKESAKDVVSANPFYFSSDRLNVLDEAGNPSEYMMYGWDGKVSKELSFAIRNYDNPLKYNNDVQNVDYVIDYDYLDAVNESEIELKMYKKVNSQWIAYTKGSTQTLAGGADTFTSDEYKLVMISKVDTAITHDISVIIKAKTKNAAYDKMICTKATLMYSEFDNFLAKQGFEAPRVNESLADLRALRYFVYTANALDAEQMESMDITSATRTIGIWFDNSILEFYEYDKVKGEYITSVTLDSVKAEAGISSIAELEADMDKLKVYENKLIIDTDNNEAYMYFEALPYSAFTFTFFKREGIYGTNDDKWKVDGTYFWDLDSEDAAAIVRAKEIVG